jgi:hypothetical protein
MAYLYGASIQGIQGFIFETNRLKEIVGASNLIEKFTSKGFIDTFINDESVEYSLLRNAGGNIRISFTSNQKALAKKFVKHFPEYIIKKAYGITVSQAILSYDEHSNNEYEKVAKSLELQLKNARNKTYLPLDAKFSLMKQSSRTGKSATETIRHPDNTNEKVDKGTYQKFDNVKPAIKDLLLEKILISTEEHRKFPLELGVISNNKNKIAVIHADGNKMGLLLQQMAKKLEGVESNEIQKQFREFSEAMEKSTKDAVYSAFSECFKLSTYGERKVPFRPIVIGGDDVTVICHADKAVEFTKLYMQYFQKNTKDNLRNVVQACNLTEFEDGLTACAGIAYCNEKFPFHYAVSLAETLCGRAKEASDREASCLLFHNIQGAAFTDYKRYVKHELILDNKRTATHLEFGPYYVDPSKGASIDGLKKVHNLMSQKDFPLGKLREWLSELALNDDYAAKYLERFNVIAKRDKNINVKEIDEALSELGDLSLDRLIDGNHKTPIHDILQLKSVQGGNV